MKHLKILTVLLLCLACVTMATASREQLPSKEDVNDFLDGCTNMSASEVMNDIKEDHSTWKADLLKDGDENAIAIYFEDSDSGKGYGSIYYQNGESVSPSTLSEYTLAESYKGEIGESENNTNVSQDEENVTDENVTTDENETVIKGDETDTEHKYEAFKTALDKYDGKTDCTSLSCATSMKDYFKEMGWTTSVKYCVAVDTSDEGTVYVVLGV